MRMGVNQRRALEARRATRNERIVNARGWFFRKGIKLVGIAIAVTVLFGGIYWGLMHIHADRWVVLQNIQVNGNQILSYEEILAAGGIEQGLPMWGLPVDSIQTRLQALDVVHSVEVSRSFPRGLRVNIVEVEPLLAIYDQRGVTLISEKGTRIPGRENQAWQAPVLVNAKPVEVKMAVKILREMRMSSPQMYHQVSQIAFGNSIEVYMRDAHYKLLLGWDSSARTYQDYLTLRRTVGKSLDSAAVVDMRFTGMALTRPWNRENTNG